MAVSKVADPSGTVVTFTETPSNALFLGSGVVQDLGKLSLFQGWGGACSGTATTCTLTITGPVTVQANFGLPVLP
jgi:hypothetical protein